MLVRPAFELEPRGLLLDAANQAAAPPRSTRLKSSGARYGGDDGRARARFKRLQRSNDLIDGLAKCRFLLCHSPSFSNSSIDLTLALTSGRPTISTIAAVWCSALLGSAQCEDSASLRGS